MPNDCQKLKNDYLEILKTRDNFAKELAEIPESKEVSKANIFKLALDLALKDTCRGIEKLKESAPCSPERAEKILGKDYLGPETISSVFHGKLREIPEIPFTIKDIEKARELGQFLILRVDGFRLSLRRPTEIWKNNLTAKGLKDMLEGPALIISNFINRAYDDFYAKEKPQPGWALVDKESVEFAPAYTTNKQSYDVQIVTMLDYLSDKVYDGRELPNEYRKLLDEYNKLMGEAFNKGNPTQPDFESVQKLGINKILRHTLVEILYDIYVYYHKNKELLFQKDGVATSTTMMIDGINTFVKIKFDTIRGLRITADGINNSKPEIGAVISRRF